MFIEEKVYIKIIDVLPIPCIDLVIMNQWKILLWMRKNNPYNGQWRIPWWRVYKWEKQYDGIKRLLNQETNLDLSAIKNKPKLLWVYDIIEQWTAFLDSQIGHAICTTYLIEIWDDFLKDIKPDSQNEELRWFFLDDVWYKMKDVLKKFNIF